MVEKLFMGPYLRDNLWKSFQVSEESFTRLSNLYSYSAVPTSRSYSESRFTSFIYSYAADEVEDVEEARKFVDELITWFERDWLTVAEADAYLLGAGDPTMQVKNTLHEWTPRDLFTALIFRPYEVHSRWVRRLWQETLLRHQGNRLVAEVELMFLIEQGEQSALDQNQA